MSCKSPQPVNEQSFGYVVWRILGGETASIRKAAQRLSINPSALSSILHGRTQISQQALIEKNWRDVFATHYPDTWLKHQADFERYATTLPEQQRKHAPQPKDEQSFGYIVWRILGGKHAKIRLAAKRLGVDPSSLSSILHGRWQISQRALTEKNWRDVLAAHYPNTWPIHQSAFEQCALTLPDPGIKPSQPEDKESLGYALWHILGGKDADIYAAAKRLKLEPCDLNDILHGRRQISQRFIATKHWRDVLALHYRGAWANHKAAFEQRAAALHVRFGNKSLRYQFVSRDRTAGRRVIRYTEIDKGSRAQHNAGIVAEVSNAPDNPDYQIDNARRAALAANDRQLAAQIGVPLDQLGYEIMQLEILHQSMR